MIPRAYADDAATPQNMVQTFTPEDFARFTPRTALDMVEQIPGFIIEEQDNSQRGFGQATGNVLINGQRLSGKSNDAIEALGRIPAASVVRIELQDGATLDIPGLSGQVVNLVAEQGTGLSGAWSWEATFRQDLEPSLLNGEISISSKFGALDWTLSFEHENPKRGNRGLEDVFDGAGNLIERREEDARFDNEVPDLSLALTWTPENGNIANFNASYQQFNFSIRERGLRMPIGGVDNFRLFKFGNDGRVAEVSGDYEFGVGPGRLKLITVQTFRTNTRASDLETTPFDTLVPFGSVFIQDSEELESIGRLEYSLAPKPGRDWQLSAEGAFNKLDNISNLLSLQPDGQFIQGSVVDQATVVEELRGEINLTHGRRLGERLTAQLSGGVEISELSQSGPSGLTRLFVRPKGFVSLAWQAMDSTTISTRIEREVGQLDFFDFVSTVNLNQENEQSGNPDIVPQQAWLGEIEIEHQFGSVGAATLRIFGELITDIVDQIPIGQTGEAPGNLDNAERFGAEFNTTLKLDRFGFEGLQFEFDAEARMSRLDDPVTGLSRRINRDLVSRIFAEFRYDRPGTPYALGINYDQRREARTFRLDQSLFRSATPGNLGVFAEHKDVFGLTATLSVNNLLGTVDAESRAVSIGFRDTPLDFFETRERTFGSIVTVSLRGSF